MKNICMITQSPYPLDPRVRKQAEVLEDAGYETDIICIRQDNQPRVERFGKITAYRVLKYEGQETLFKYLFGSIAFFTLSFFKLQLLYMKRRYKLIQIHNMPDFHIFTALFQKLLKVPLVLDLHDLTVEIFEAKWPGNKHSGIKKLVGFAEKLSCKIADALITVSDGCKDRLVRRGNPSEKITLIFNTANSRIFKFDDSRVFHKIERGANLLYHGTVAERFGLHIAIEAMEVVVKKIPESTFYIYGKYDIGYKKFLEDRVKSLGLEGRVVFNGTVILEKVYELILKADIGIVPYLDYDYSNIGLSNKAFEYAASGLPIVASRLHSLVAVFDEKSVRYAQAENPEDFAAKIVELCLNPELRKKQTQNALESLSRISENVMRNRYLKLIQSLIGDLN